MTLPASPAQPHWPLVNMHMTKFTCSIISFFPFPDFVFYGALTAVCQQQMGWKRVGILCNLQQRTHQSPQHSSALLSQFLLHFLHSPKMIKVVGWKPQKTFWGTTHQQLWSREGLWRGWEHDKIHDFHSSFSSSCYQASNRSSQGAFC